MLYIKQAQTSQRGEWPCSQSQEGHGGEFPGFHFSLMYPKVYPGCSVVTNPPTNADAGSSLGSGRSLGVGNGNPLLYSFLEKPINRGAWRAMGSHRVGNDLVTKQQCTSN